LLRFQVNSGRSELTVVRFKRVLLVESFSVPYLSIFVTENGQFKKVKSATHITKLRSEVLIAIDHYTTIEIDGCRVQGLSSRQSSHPSMTVDF